MKPNEKDAILSEVGVKKIYCGRKSKFGLNMQCACDSKGKFLDASIGNPISASDYLAFVTSSLQRKLENHFFAPGLVFHGDNAYVSNEFMATPIKNFFSGVKDTHNFY